MIFGSSIWKFYLTFVFNFLPNWGFFYDLRKPTGLKQQANLGAGISHVSLNKIHMLKQENEQIITYTHTTYGESGIWQRFVKQAYFQKGLLSFVPDAPHLSPPPAWARLPKRAQTGLCKVLYSNNQRWVFSFGSSLLASRLHIVRFTSVSLWVRESQEK